MYRTIEINEYVEDPDLSLTGRVGADEDDITLQLNCTEVTVSKTDIRKMQRWLAAVLKEAA